ncbi:protein hupE [Mesorhizobium sp. L-8-10]|uniref:HupE/UreJ family protein n=1 Tax=unclassified Mesorhizobium TaxID=325217 RepID=UPI00193702C0|nr:MULTISPECIES: HupE/UreJ family protein [unclassified Mesorhizobium]BCH20593.1 protein hupE [Mesorhizobium sp. L-8-3]BCH28440.1 protein hupE [Mesorhizobium sp. L-8-10]
MNIRATRLTGAATAIMALTPSIANAHTGGDPLHGLVAGLAHPIFGLDHLLAMLAVGMIAARTGGRGIAALPLSFVAAMLAGAALGMSGVALPAVEPSIALSLVVLGAIMAFGRRQPLARSCALVGLFGLFHGHAHGLEVPASASGLAYVAGFVAATLALHGTGALVGARGLLMRGFGAGTALFGLAIAATQAV